MANCYQYNCASQLGDHTLNDCEEEVPGGFRNVILLECNHELTDASNGTAVQAEIDAGRATLIKNVKVSIPAASPVTVPSNIANTPDKVVKYQYEITYMDGNINPQNMTFYNEAFSGRQFGGLIVHQADEGVVHFFNKDFRMQGSLVAPDNDGENQRYEGTIRMEAKNDAVNPVYSTEPPGVFD